jgi:hypothetical protein
MGAVLQQRVLKSLATTRLLQETKSGAAKG